MRVLRAAHYSQMSDTPTIAIVRDGDTTDTLDSICYSSRMPGGLTLCEIFEVPDGTSTAEASLLAGQRHREATETMQAQATLFFWTVDRMLPGLPKGPTSARYPGPTPLTHDQVVEVMEQVAIHPNYRNEVMLGVPDHDGVLVVLENGKVR